MDGKKIKPDNKLKTNISNSKGSIGEPWQFTDAFVNHQYSKGQKVTTEKNEHICLRCGKQCKTLSALKMHLLHKHPDCQIEVKCAVCDKIFDSLMSLLQHVRYKHRYNHRCKTCYRDFTTADQLSNHKQCCSKGETTCRECGKIHPGNKNNYYCDLCQCKFTTFSDLSKHMVSTHSSKSKPSNWYGDCFNSLQSISNKNRYHCGICKNKFNSSTAIVQHLMKIHTF